MRRALVRANPGERRQIYMQIAGGCPPGHLLRSHRVENEEHTRAFRRVRVGDVRVEPVTVWKDREHAD
jgi:hypothetical protein